MYLTFHMLEAMPKPSPAAPEKKRALPPRPEQKRITPPEPQAKEIAVAIPEDDIRELDEHGNEIVTEDDFVTKDEEGVEEVDLQDIEYGADDRSGKFSVPPPPRRPEQKKQEQRKPINFVALQKERAIEARQFELIDGVEAAFTMHKGDKRGDEEPNEDCVRIFEDPEFGVVGGVFDGLGGEGNGALASAKASEVLLARMRNALETVRDLNPSVLELVLVPEVHLVVRDGKTGELAHAKKEEQIITSSYIDVDPAIAKKAIALSSALKAINHDVKATNGKTTACVSMIHTTEDGRRFSITANIGDSGALRRKSDGSIERMTIEDSALDGLMEAGVITPELFKEMRENPDKDFTFGRTARTYRQLRLMNTQALGADKVSPRITIEELEEGDELVMLTDGYLDFLEHEGELDTDAIKGAMNEKDPVSRLNRLTEITKVMERIQVSEGSNLKKPDDKAAVTLRAKPLAKKK